METGSPADIQLRRPDGSPTTFGEYRHERLIVILVRYFGCLPCQEFVVDVDQVTDQWSENASIIAIGGSAEFQARWLHDKKNVEMPLLLDPEQQVREYVHLNNLSAAQMATSKGMKNYVGSLTHGFRPQRITGDARKAPGVALFNNDFELEWIHRGTFIGDYPSVPELVERALGKELNDEMNRSSW